MRRVACLILAMTAFAAPVKVARAERSFSKFIVITVDTLRADHLGCYGASGGITPNVDGFATGCVQFQWAFSAAPFTGPSMLAMHTSRFPGQNEQLFSNGAPWPKLKVPTLARELERRGFSTAAFVGNFVLREAVGLAGGFELYNAEFDSEESNRGVPERTCGSLADAAEKWLEKNHKDRFFLWLHFQDPHGPYSPPEPFASAFAPQQPSVELPIGENNHGYKAIPPYQQLGESRDLALYQSRYKGEIRYLDDRLGAFFKKLDDLGLTDETVVIFTADHGEAFGENDYYCAHGQFLTPELTRVPLLMRVPGRQPEKPTAPVSLVDLAPTILELAGTKSPKSFQGVSLLRTMEKNERGKPFFVESSAALGVVDSGLMFIWGLPAPATGKAQNDKVYEPDKISFNEAPMALYELDKDPACSTNAADKHPKWFRYLRNAGVAYLKECSKTPRTDRAVSMDKITRKKLRSLGYLND